MILLLLAAGNGKSTNVVPPANESGAVAAVTKQISVSTASAAIECVGGTEVNRVCVSCNTAKITYKKSDCSEATSEVTDVTCTTGCSTATASAPPPLPQPPQVPTYDCNCNKTCEQISTCEEAQYQLNVCGCKRRDADKDGIACDAAPLYCQS